MPTYALVLRWHAFDWSQPAFGLVGAGTVVMRIFWTVVIFGILWKALLGTIRTMSVSLYLTIILAATIALLVMSRTNTKAGADYVVLSMSIGVAVAFVIAVINKVSGLKLLSKLAEQVVFVMVPPLGLIFLVLGTIFIGVATPTEGGAMGAAGAMILARDERPAYVRPNAAGGRGHRQALRLRGLHPDRRARVLVDVLWRQRPRLGRGIAGRHCRAARPAS